MERRQYLRTAVGGAAGTLALAGCLGSGDENPNVKLSKPDLQTDPEDYPFPAWGQQIPSVTVPDALGGGTVTTTDYEKPLALTFVFSNCQTACPILTRALVAAQREAADGGWSDAVEFAEITFDPARDTPERLAEYADERSVDLDAGNWTFLRPESEARAKTVVQDEFGVFYEKIPPGEMSGGDSTATPDGSGTATATETASETTEASGTETDGTVDEDSAGYMFRHLSLILLVNGDGYVERTWRGSGGIEAAAAELPDAMDRLRTA
ncbi:SCO family protein [Halorientalis halophila]|uniref:SCO family protein n=1 Tax=Halorientalis halophila TaxID=3108499 RepID=UPI00300B3801